MLEKALFRARGREFTRAHVLNAADFRGELQPIRARIRAGLACHQYAADEKFEADADDLQAAADRYRYGRNLTTAEDTERWLQDHDFTIEDFTDWLERRAYLERFAADMDAIVADYPCSSEAIDDLLWAELVFGDHLSGLTRRLAARVALLVESGWPDAARPWPDELAAMERLYAEKREQLLTHANRERELVARRPSFLRFDVEMASFASLEAAHEAWSCASVDREPLAEVAARAGGSFERTVRFLDGFPEPLRPAIFSAAFGDVLDPVQDDEQVVVCLVRDKVPPEPNDTEVSALIESALMVRALGDLIQKHVVWLDPSSAGGSPDV